MKQIIHPLREGEKVLNQGSYLYIQHGRDSGYVERWMSSSLPGGGQTIRAEIDGSRADGFMLASHLQLNADQKAMWLRLRFGKDRFTSNAQYTFQDDSIKIARQPEGHPVQQEVVDIASNYVLEYPPIIGHRYPWTGYRREEPAETLALPIFSPDVWIPGAERMTGRAVRFRVTPQGPSECRVPAGLFSEALAYSIETDDGVRAEAWYDEAGTPLRWLYPDKDYESVLAEYSPQESSQ